MQGPKTLLLALTTLLPLLNFADASRIDFVLAQILILKMFFSLYLGQLETISLLFMEEILRNSFSHSFENLRRMAG